MKIALPEMLASAISTEVWKTVDPDTIRLFLGNNLPDMELFKDRAAMEWVADQIEAAAFVDAPQFCMGRNLRIDDPRLDIERAVFIAGSLVPGDDVFVAVDLRRGDSDPQLLVFDWEKAIPNRWVARGTLSQLIHKMTQ